MQHDVRRSTAAVASFQELLGDTRFVVFDRRATTTKFGSRPPLSYDGQSSKLPVDKKRLDHSPLGGRDASASPAAKKTRVRVRVKTAHRREQCRLNQARYRAKQAAAGRALRVCVDELHGDVQRLLVRQQHLQQQRVHRSLFNDSAHDAASHLIVTLFDVLRHGLTSGVDRQQQLALLAKGFHEYVAIDDVQSRAAVVAQWHGFSTLWGGLSLRLQRVDCVQIDDHDDERHVTLREALRLNLTITPLTIRHVFPHLLLDVNQRLLSRLLGRHLECDVMGIHVFNTKHQITRVEWFIDFVGALSQYLELRDVAQVLQHAQIKRDAYLTMPVRESAASESARYPLDQSVARLEVDECDWWPSRSLEQQDGAINAVCYGEGAWSHLKSSSTDVRPDQ